MPRATENNWPCCWELCWARLHSRIIRYFTLQAISIERSLDLEACATAPCELATALTTPLSSLLRSRTS